MKDKWMQELDERLRCCLVGHDPDTTDDREYCYDLVNQNEKDALQIAKMKRYTGYIKENGYTKEYLEKTLHDYQYRHAETMVEAQANAMTIFYLSECLEALEMMRYCGKID